MEASTFGSEFTAMKTDAKLIRVLWYKLRVIGVPLKGLTSLKAASLVDIFMRLMAVTTRNALIVF